MGTLANSRGPDEMPLNAAFLHNAVISSGSALFAKTKLSF